MSWRELIPSGSGWVGIAGYCDERIAELTAVCVDMKAPDADIRAAQAGIDEMRRLKALPATLQTSATQRGAARRKEY